MSNDVATIVINGLVNGCIYALIGVGFVVIFRATGVVSFAQGAFMVLGAEIFASLVNDGLSTGPAAILAAGGAFIFGGLVYWLAFSRLTGAEAFITSVATVGLGILVEAGVLLIWGPAIIVIPQLFSYQVHHVVGQLGFSNIDLFAMAVTVAVFAVVLFGLHRTPVGLRMRAVANNPRLAVFTGVNVLVTSTLAWAIAGLTAALAGIVYLVGTQPDPGSIYALGLAAFPAILLGGFDSIPGTLVGGIIIGLVQATVAVYVGGAWQDVVAYGVLLAVLLLRPQGMFGSPQVARL